MVSRVEKYLRPYLLQILPHAPQSCPVSSKNFSWNDRGTSNRKKGFRPRTCGQCALRPWYKKWKISCTVRIRTANARFLNSWGYLQEPVRRIIRQDLAGVLRHKRKTHMLSGKQVSQRLLKIPRLLKHLQGEKWRYIVSIDEAWVYLTHVNGRRKVYYQFRGKRSPQSWMKHCQQKHPRGVMFVAGISARGPTAIRFVPPSTKVNADFYVHRVLQPLFQKDIKRLYGKSAKRVKLHHDSAPTHRALATVRFMQENKYEFIPASDWPANSPDLSPMDYSINGIFKQRLWKRKAKDLQGLVRAMKQEWSLISKKLCVETLESWSTRAQRVLDNSGYQIEHLV